MEKITKPVSGFSALLLSFILAAAAVYLFFLFTENEEHITYLIIALILFLTAVFLFKGLVVISPNRAVVLTFLGKYMGSVKENGLLFVNPLYFKQRLSLRS